MCYFSVLWFKTAFANPNSSLRPLQNHVKLKKNTKYAILVFYGSKWHSQMQKTICESYFS